MVNEKLMDGKRKADAGPTMTEPRMISTWESDNKFSSILD